ncbi:uncharacterized protein A4U43_C01F21110 [Asparagus officinalis]|uniref:Glycosyltransferase n=1 Tax=Asparagus officinalis TaxID=4686 RepID=A0A5P1FRL4_ASPOF|nr:UDP-glycosyltransferase 73C5-like [Asparagus officinalis]ONK80732.1 uncharacterized protein A4U43_C01F21110 [Asparagus officinalis]
MGELTVFNGSNDHKCHFVLVPLMAQGHMIPMVDMAQIIAARGALVSFVTTPVNAARIRPIIDRVKSHGLPIRFVELTFPCAESGLPEGCENVDLLPSMDLTRPFFDAVSLLRGPFESFVRDVEPVPSCMIVDYCSSFTAGIAQEMDIPRIIFHGPSCFYILCFQNLWEHKEYHEVDEFEPIVIPDMAQQVKISRAQAPGWFPGPDWKEVRDKAMEAEVSAQGVIVNTFHELEPEFVECYRKKIKKPVWPIGPFSLYNKDFTSKASRGKKSSVDERQVSSWLDSKETRSVVFVNFGSLVRTKVCQLIEIGRGLLASNRPFIWVLKEEEECCPEFRQWMSEELEGMEAGERSLVITGWAPQAVILSHPSVGGFVTHCGWNSILEAVCAGVPMITWPHFADQFLNEKLVVEVLKVGVDIGVRIPVYMMKENEVSVKGEAVEKAISRLMDDETDEESKERRGRAAKLAQNAWKAMEEGGSSYENLTRLIEYVSESSKLA